MAYQTNLVILLNWLNVKFTKFKLFCLGKTSYLRVLCPYLQHLIIFDRRKHNMIDLLYDLINPIFQSRIKKLMCSLRNFSFVAGLKLLAPNPTAPCLSEFFWCKTNRKCKKKMHKMQKKTKHHACEDKALLWFTVLYTLSFFEKNRSKIWHSLQLG